MQTSQPNNGWMKIALENTLEKSKCLSEGECTFWHLADEVHPLRHIADEDCTLQKLEGWPRLSSRSTGGILKRSSSYKNRKQGDCREVRQRHYTSSDCVDATTHDDINSDQIISDNEIENDEADLSLTLTTQNPSRIDVKTLRKKKVNKLKSKLKLKVNTWGFAIFIAAVS